MDEFAVLLNNIHKIVISHSLENVSWQNSTLFNGDLTTEVMRLKQLPGKNILVGGPSIIIQLMNLGLIDEYHFCIQPIILGEGLPLFKNISNRLNLTLISATPLASGAVTHIYRPAGR